MYIDKKDKIVNALDEAADHVRNQPIHEHHAMLEAGAIPPWVSTLIQTLIQTLGPAFAQALQQWLSQIVPNNPNPPKPA